MSTIEKKKSALIEKKKSAPGRFSTSLTFLSILIFFAAFYVLSSNVVISGEGLAVMFIKAGVCIGLLVLSVVLLRLSSHWNAVINLFKGARIERRKVVWPGKSEWVKTTWMVIIVVAIFSIFLMLVDSLLTWIIKIVLQG